MDFKETKKKISNITHSPTTGKVIVKAAKTLLEYYRSQEVDESNRFDIGRTYDNLVHDGKADKKTTEKIQVIDKVYSFLSNKEQEFKVKEVTKQINDTVEKINKYKETIKNDKFVEMARQLRILETAKFGEIAYEEYYDCGDAYFLPISYELIDSALKLLEEHKDIASLSRSEAHKRLKEVSMQSNILRNDEDKFEAEIEIQRGILKIYQTICTTYEQTIEIFDIIITDLVRIVEEKDKVGSYSKLSGNLKTSLSNILKVKGYLKDLAENSFSNSPTMEAIEIFKQQVDRNYSHINNLYIEINKS